MFWLETLIYYLYEEMPMRTFWPVLFIMMAVIALAAGKLAFDSEENYAKCWARMQQGLNMERKAPSDMMNVGDLKYNEGQVMITYNITYPCWSGTVDSTIEYGEGSKRSMIPTIAQGHQALCLNLNSMDCLNEGDIVVNKETGNTHRIIEKGVDSKGDYLLTMGDNNFEYSDLDVELRDASKLCVVFGIIY
jgi:hypothetical protein